MIDEIRRGMARYQEGKQKKWYVSAFSLDVEKAFDSVWHEGLIYKIMKAGTPMPYTRLVISFLCDRTIQVRIKNELSRRVKLEAGTPQGSALSPLLYLV